MRKCLTFRLKILPLILVAVALGCLPETKRVEVGPKTVTTQPPPLSVETLDKKIAYLTTMLDEQELDDQDKAVASDLLATYKTIRANLQSQSSEYDEGKIIQLLFANLGRLEGEIQIFPFFVLKEFLPFLNFYFF